MRPASSTGISGSRRRPSCRLAWSDEPVSDLRIGDFNGDGISDVFTTHPRDGGGYQMLYSPGGIDNWIPLGVSSQPAANLRIGDFDGDTADDAFEVDALVSGGYRWSYSPSAKGTFVPLAWSYEQVSGLRAGDILDQR